MQRRQMRATAPTASGTFMRLVLLASACLGFAVSGRYDSSNSSPAEPPGSHRQLQGLPPSLLKFTGVRLVDNVKAKASVAGAKQLYTQYIQRMKRTETIKANWDSLRKKGKATLLASFSADEAALAAACLPDSWDSRTIEVVTPVKYQGDCGSCVAYALAAAAETAILMSRKGTENTFREFRLEDAVFDISEEQLYFCSDEKRTCSSGWDLRPALNFLEKSSAQGTALYTSQCVDYDPDDSDTSCKPKCLNSAPKGTFSWDPYDDQLSAQRAIVRLGGVLTYLWFSQDLSDFLSDSQKSKGVFKSQGTDGIMHAVFVVGYSNPGKYWIVKNSFGTASGDGGYFKVGYGEAGIMEPDRIYGLRFSVDAKDKWAEQFPINLERIPTSRNCYTYFTSKGDTLEWLHGVLGLKLSAMVADNPDMLANGLNVLEPGKKLKLCDVPQGRFRPGLAQVYQRYPQMTADGFMYMRVDVLKATFWVFASPVATYQAAQSLCEKHGGKLATMESTTELNRVTDAVVDLHGFRPDASGAYKYKHTYQKVQVDLWIGYRKPSGSNAWVDALGRSESSWLYKAWFTSQPSPVSGELCAVMQVNNNNVVNNAGEVFQVGWYSEWCNRPRWPKVGVVCRFPVSVAPLGTQQPVWKDNSKNLLPTVIGKTSKGDSYIEVVLTDPASDKGIFRLINTSKVLTQKVAQAYCKQIGGQLASVHSKQALDYLQASFLGADVNGLDWITLDWAWIGLHKDGPGKPLQWLDGTKVDYVKWAYGSPGDADTLDVALSLSAVFVDSYYFMECTGWIIDKLICKMQGRGSITP